MAFFDDYDIDTTILTSVSNSGNTSTSNTANLAVDLDNVGNTNDSVNDSGNLAVGVDDSFHSNSHNTEWDIDDSGNEGSYNDWVTITDESVTDNSINAGVREYNTGFGDVELGGGGGGGGDVWINNQNTIVDQSSSGNILAGGGVFQYAANEAVVASGEGALAAGDDVTVTQSLDASTTINSGGDVLIDSEKNVDVAIGSNNTTTVDVDITDASQSWDIDDSGNTYSATLDINDSFNEESVEVDYDDWDVDANVIWDSDLAAIADDIDIDL
jgi:hypothetical protein